MKQEPEKKTLTIKLQPYLQEFIQAALNDNVKSSLKNWFGKQLQGKIERRPQDQPPLLNTGPDYFTFELTRSDKLNIDCNLWISPENQKLLEDSIRLLFFHLYYQFMDDKMKYDIIIDGRIVRKGQIKNCILEFCQFYNIPFNRITYDMLKQRYFRYRREQKQLKELNRNQKKYVRNCYQIVL